MREGMAREGIGNGIVGADCQAVEANNASAHVGHMVVEIDARCLANVDTASTLGAAVSVDVDMKRGIAGHEPQRGR